MQFNTQSPLNLHLEMFLLHQEASRHTERTIGLYSYNLNRFLGFLAEFDIQSSEEITAYHIRKFLAQFDRPESSGAYAHVHARCIKTWLNFLVAEGILTESPMKTVKMPKIDEQILPPFTEDEVRRLLAACTGEFQRRDRAAILSLLDSGLRAAEFVSLDVGDMESDGVITILGKGRKERWVRLSARTRKELLRYIAERESIQATDPLWIGRKGRLTVNGLFQVMKRIGQRAEVWPVGLHRFRRTFAIASLRNGMDVHRLKEILGHNDLTTTIRYLKFVREDIIEAHQRASPVDNWRL